MRCMDDSPISVPAPSPEHTPYQSAIRLLETFAQSGCDPFEFVRAHMFGYTFSIDGWSPADYDAGLAHAVERGWIMTGTENRICTTEEGLAQVAG